MNYANIMLSTYSYYSNRQRVVTIKLKCSSFPGFGYGEWWLFVKVLQYTLFWGHRFGITIFIDSWYESYFVSHKNAVRGATTSDWRFYKYHIHNNCIKNLYWSLVNGWRSPICIKSSAVVAPIIACDCWSRIATSGILLQSII